MNLQALILHFGLPAIFVGTLIEGEVVLLLAGILAHQGGIPIASIILTAALGTILADQTVFMMGRHGGQAALADRPEWQARLERIRPWLKRLGPWAVIIFRWVYGLRTLIALTLGASGMSPLLFLAINTVGVLVWATLVTLIGFLFGRAAEWLWHSLRGFGLAVLAAAVLAGVGVWIYRRARKGRG